jgi:hypothetical protein
MKTLEKLLPFVSGAIYVFPITVVWFMIYGGAGIYDQMFQLLSLSVIFAVLGSLFILLVNYKTKKSKLYYLLGGLVPGLLILGVVKPFIYLFLGL